jgi:myo-inositol 2-dehydrogenase/D-chiro-inositol 1-dehydrogenase
VLVVMTGGRVAIVGCGFIGGVHSMVLRGLRLGGVITDEVVATCDEDITRARLFAESHGAAIATTDPHEAIAACDMVWICTPTSTHFDLVGEAARQGVAVYCEKPVAPTLAEAEALADTATAAGLAVQVGLVLRHSPAIVAIAELIGSGEYGRPMTAVLRDDQYFPIQGQYASDWRADASIAGGGTLIEHSIHDFDLLCWLLGPATRVTAQTASFAGHAGIEDAAVASIVHQGGAMSSLTSVWHGILTRPSTRRLEVFCERALIWTDDEHAGPVWLHTDAGVRTLESLVGPEDETTVSAVISALEIPEMLRGPLTSYILADQAFVDAVRRGEDPCPGLAEALEAHRNVDEAYQSASAARAASHDDSD